MNNETMNEIDSGICTQTYTFPMCKDTYSESCFYVNVLLIGSKQELGKTT